MCIYIDNTHIYIYIYIYICPTQHDPYPFLSPLIFKDSHSSKFKKGKHKHLERRWRRCSTPSKDASQSSRLVTSTRMKPWETRTFRGRSSDFVLTLRCSEVLSPSEKRMNLSLPQKMGMDQYLWKYHFNGMNIHLPAILMWTTGVQGFDTLPDWTWWCEQQSDQSQVGV